MKTQNRSWIAAAFNVYTWRRLKTSCNTIYSSSVFHIKRWTWGSIQHEPWAISDSENWPSACLTILPIFTTPRGCLKMVYTTKFDMYKIKLSDISHTDNIWKMSVMRVSCSSWWICNWFHIQLVQVHQIMSACSAATSKCTFLPLVLSCAWENKKKLLAVSIPQTWFTEIAWFSS